MLIEGPAVAVYAVRAEELLAGYSGRVATDTFGEQECSRKTVGGVCLEQRIKIGCLDRRRSAGQQHGRLRVESAT